jgi:hypothetical protein
MTTAPDLPDEDEAPEPVFGQLPDWVDHFLESFPRPLGGEYRWCRKWWLHPEAITRLTALWHSWEVLRLQPGTGIANWLRDYLDHQLPILLGRSGPFASCNEDEHTDPRIAGTDPQPAWLDETEAGPPPLPPPSADAPDTGP